MLQNHAEEPETGSPAAASSRFGRDFSQIPVRPPAVKRKLTVGPSSLPRERQDGEDVGVAAPPIVHEVVRSPGDPLDARTRSRFESRLGHHFSNVRVHADARAAESALAVQALAYTVGNHIAFGDGLYAPDTAAGDELLAHELAHTVEQTSAPGTNDVVRRRRIPAASKLAVTMPSGGTDVAAHQAGLLRVVSRAWEELTVAQKATVRAAAAAFGISGATDALIMAALAAGTRQQLLRFAGAIRAADPTTRLGDPALIDIGARPGTSDAANIATLVSKANAIFTEIALGLHDADITDVFGAANVAAAKTKYALARTAMNSLHTSNHIVTDRSGYSAEVFLGGLTNSSQISLEPNAIDDPTNNVSVATMVHEAMHAGGGNVHDLGYTSDGAFTKLSESVKLMNAAHFEVVAWRKLDATAHDAFAGITFIPAGSSVGGVSAPPLTPKQQAMRDTSEAWRGAWSAGLNLHGLWVRIFRRPIDWDTVDVGVAYSGAAAGEHFSTTMPFWSKVEMLTVHDRPGLHATTTFASQLPVTSIDVALSEGLTRKLARGMDAVPDTEADATTLETSRATAAERAAAAGSVAAETKLLKTLVVRVIGEMTGPETRDVQVVDRMAAAYAAPDFSDMLQPRSPSTFP